MPVLLSSSFNNALVILLSVAALAVLAAAIFRIMIAMHSAGTEKMQAAARTVQGGALLFLRRVYRAIGILTLLLCTALYIGFDTGLSQMQAGNWGMPVVTGSFVLGVLLSVLAATIGTRTTVVANVRTTQAARTGLAKAFRIAFLGGATAGLIVVGFSLLGVIGVLLYLLQVMVLPMAEALHTLLGFALGVSMVSLLLRISGGIYAKAADIGADTARRTESGIIEDDLRNPATIADMAGDAVGNVAGMSTDLLESTVSSVLAAMLIGLTVEWGVESAVLFPLYVSALGVVATLCGTFAVRLRKGGTNIRGALKHGLLLTASVSLAGTFFLASHLLPRAVWFSVFSAMAGGLIAGVVVGLFAEYYTSDDCQPVRRLAEYAKQGAAMTVIRGMALGHIALLLPVLFFGGAIALGFSQVGLYGIAIAAVGMLSMLGMSLAIDVYGSVADNAGGLATMAALPETVRKRTDALDRAGNTTAVIGKGFAIGSATFTTLALLSVFADTAELANIDLLHLRTFIGLLIGATLPYLFSAMILSAVTRASVAVLTEAKRQFSEIRGLLTGNSPSESDRCVVIAASAGIRQMLMPGVLAISMPVIVGFALGTAAVGGLIAGSLVSGVLMALALSHAGGAWDNMKKYVEAGHFGGHNSDVHRAAAVGDTVGDALKDAVAPAMNVLLKLMALVSVLAAGLFPVTGLL